MGRSFYSITEAASRLGRSKRSVYDYVKKGFLREEVQDGKRVVDREDVEQLAADKLQQSPVVNRKTLFTLTNRVEKLENEMRAALGALELRDVVIRPQPPEAIEYYKTATESLSRKDLWTLEEIEGWANLFATFDELTLETFTLAVQDNKAWVPFYQLCLGMLGFVTKKNTAKPELPWVQAQERLELGRVKLRSAIILLIEMRKGVTPETLMALAENPKEVVMQGLRS